MYLVRWDFFFIIIFWTAQRVQEMKHKVGKRVWFFLKSARTKGKENNTLLLLTCPVTSRHSESDRLRWKRPCLNAVNACERRSEDFVLDHVCAVSLSATRWRCSGRSGFFLFFLLVESKGGSVQSSWHALHVASWAIGFEAKLHLERKRHRLCPCVWPMWNIGQRKKNRFMSSFAWLLITGGNSLLLKLVSKLWIVCSSRICCD